MKENRNPSLATCVSHVSSLPDDLAMKENAIPDMLMSSFPRCGPNGKIPPSIKRKALSPLNGKVNRILLPIWLM